MVLSVRWPLPSGAVRVIGFVQEFGGDRQEHRTSFIVQLRGPALGRVHIFKLLVKCHQFESPYRTCTGFQAILKLLNP